MRMYVKRKTIGKAGREMDREEDAGGEFERNSSVHAPAYID